MSILGFMKRHLGHKDVAKPSAPTIDELRGRTYAVFMNSGVRIDLDRYFSTASGQKALERVAQSAVRQSSRKDAE